MLHFMAGRRGFFFRPALLILAILQLISCGDEESNTLPDISFTLIQHTAYAKFIMNPAVHSGCNALTYNVFIKDSLVLSKVATDTFSIAGLKENTLYKGKIEAFCQADKIGQSTFSFTTSQNQAPGEVKIERLSFGPGHLEVRWKPAVDPESNMVTYCIYLNQQLKDSLSGQTISTITGLQPGTYYILRIVAKDQSGKYSEVFTNFRTLSYGSGTLVRSWISYQGYEREASWYVPPTTGSVAMPLVMDLHGANGNAWLQIQQSDYNRLAEENDFIHVMPQALQGTFNGETLFQWNAHFIFPWDDVKFIDHLIENLKLEYAIDTNRLYLTGMSNGGFMTFFSAAYSNHQWAAIAPIAGLISANVFTGYALKRAIPLCYMHGTADPIVLINGIPSANDIINFWVGNNECSPIPEVTKLPDLNTSDNSTVTVLHYPGFTSRSEVIYYMIEGGGHSVPGVEPGANMDINAYEEIWSFFSRHQVQ